MSKQKIINYVSYLNPGDRNKKPNLLRDVMNSKSSFIKRHSVDAYNIKELSKWYAIDSHMYNSIWDEENSKWKRGNAWIMNTMVFDIDLDSEHCIGLNDEEIKEKLSNSIKKLESILGTPKFIIRNKNYYSKNQIDTYFTKIDNNGNKIIKKPKKYGCQVIYELKDSIKSEMIGVRDVYNYVRLTITDIIGADKQFNGYMHKNYYNKDLFDITENKNHNLIDIFYYAKMFKYRNKNVPEDIINNTDEILNLVKNLKPFEKLGDNTKLNKHLKKYTLELYSYYNQLNRWNGLFDTNFENNYNDNNSKDIKNTINLDAKTILSIKTESRNNTLFNLFKIIPLNILENYDINYFKSLIDNLNLFSNCLESSMLEDFEIESTRQSVLNYRINNRDFEIDNINTINIINNSSNLNKIDYRVFKEDQNSFNFNFFNENKINLINSMNRVIYSQNFKNRTIKRYWLNKYPIKIKLYELCGDVESDFINTLSNIFLYFSAEKILKNINNLFSQQMIDFYQEIYSRIRISNRNFANSYKLNLYQLFNCLKSSIYLTHFKYYRSIQDYRKNNKNNSNNKKKNNICKNTRNIEKYGVYYNGSILGMNKYLKQLKKDNLLKKDGTPYPISFYQSKFRIKTSTASIYVRKIKNFNSIIKNTEKIKTRNQSIKNIFFLISVKELIVNNKNINNNNNNNIVIYINPSQSSLYIINIFNIYSNIFYNNNINNIYYKILIYYINYNFKNNILIKICNNTNKTPNNFNNTDELYNNNIDNNNIYYINYIFNCNYICNCDNLFIIKGNKNKIKNIKRRFLKMKYLLFDTETTGLNARKSFILSIGAILYDSETNEKSEFYKVLNWKKIMNNFYIPEDTIKVHGITLETLDKKGEHPLNVMSDFIKWINEFCDCCRLDSIVAFNIPFDLNMMISNLKYLIDVYCSNFEHDSILESNTINLLNLLTRRYHEELNNHPLIIDSLVIDRIFHFEVDGEKVSHNLQAVGERYGIPEDPNAHNAIADTRRTLEVFKIQLNELKDLGIEVDQKFEDRLIRKYNREQEYRGWNKKPDAVDYLAEKMVAVGA